MFRNIKLWEIPPEVLLEQHLSGLLPLLPLTQEGNRRGVVELMFSRLQQAGKLELIALGHALSVLVMEQGPDQQWLKEISMSMENILEDSWFYQEILQKGMAKGIETSI